MVVQKTVSVVVFIAVLQAVTLSTPTFTLSGNDYKEIQFGDKYTKGELNDDSSADIAGGNIAQLYTDGNSEVVMSDGSVGEFSARGQSILNMSGGSIEELFADEQSIINITGGLIERDLMGYGDAQITLSGGQSGDDLYLDAFDCASITFNAHAWELTPDPHWGGDLTVDNDQILGSGEGMLSVFWHSESQPWTASLWKEDTAQVFLNSPSTEPAVIPAPGAVLLAAIGAGTVAQMRRRKVL